jgi:hypothetical protein
MKKKEMAPPIQVCPHETGRRPAWKVPDDYRWFDEVGACWDRTVATTNVYAVKPGCTVYYKARMSPVYYETRLSEVNVEGVRQVLDADQLRSKGAAGIKSIVSASGLAKSRHHG